MMEVQSMRCDGMEEYLWKQVCRQDNDQKVTVTVRYDAEKQQPLAIMGMSLTEAGTNNTCKEIL